MKLKIVLLLIMMTFMGEFVHSDPDCSEENIHSDPTANIACSDIANDEKINRINSNVFKMALGNIQNEACDPIAYLNALKEYERRFLYLNESLCNFSSICVPGKCGMSQGQSQSLCNYQGKDFLIEHLSKMNFMSEGCFVDKIGMNNVEAIQEIKPSFNCVNKTTYDEALICNNEILSVLDSYLSELYVKSLSLSNGDYELRASQKSWIKERASCNSEGCIQDKYIERIKSIKSTYGISK